MSLLRTATIVAAVGTAVSGGALFAFSAFVMPALRSLPEPVGIRAMQAINIAAPTPPFMIVLFGSGALAVGVSVAGIVRGGSWLLVPAAALALGTLVITGGYHVPRNDALALVVADAPGAASFWHTYVVEWTRMNSVRAASAIGASVLYVAALR